MNRNAGILQELDDQFVDTLTELVEEGQQGFALNLIAEMHPADVAFLLERIDNEAAVRLFDWLNVPMQSEVIAELDGNLRNLLLEDWDAEEIVEVVDEMDSDDAADLVADLPEHLAEEVLTVLEDGQKVRTLLAFDEDTAGGLMGFEYVAVPKTWNIAEVTGEVRKQAEEVEQVYVVYVLDEEKKLCGFLTLEQIILSPDFMSVQDVMDDEVVYVTADTDQEEVARIFERYDLLALPVVDQNGHLLGRITIDDILDVIREEAEEDMQRMSGISAEGEEVDDSIFKISRGRLPWLMVGLTGSLISAFVIEGFTGFLEREIILSMFIGVIGSTSGNVGIQSSAIAVQGLAKGDIWQSDLLARIGKEVLVALINALGLVMMIFVVLMGAKGLGLGTKLHHVDMFRLMSTVGLSLSVSILLAATIGSAMPILLDKFGIDPAIATGPFVTTSNDILGVLFYFLIARWIYHL